MASPSDSIISALEEIPTVSSTSDASFVELPPHMKREINEHGTGLGVISPNMFDPRRWSPATPVLDIQYIKFVTIIIARIRAGESNIEEVKLFVELLMTDGEDAFWKPVADLVPELDFDDPCLPAIEHSNPPLKFFYMLIYFEMEVRRQALLGSSLKSGEGEVEESIENGLERGSKEALRKVLFGKEAVIYKGGRRDELLKSWLEMGYPNR